jgi:hypothetical protein
MKEFNRFGYVPADFLSLKPIQSLFHFCRGSGVVPQFIDDSV